jgi:hypothetical protein
MQTAKRYFEGCELDDPFALRWAHLPELPAVSTRHWFRHKQRIKWRTTPKEFRIHARLGDARLEYLVPLVLRNNYGWEGLPPVRRFPNTLVTLEILSLYVQIAVKYLQSNKVLGAIAFAYGFRDDGVARPPKSRLHYYADMLEAFIETVFDDNASAGTEWLEALWSSRCFPDLQSCIEDHWRSYGQCHSSPCGLSVLMS